jgi:F0F1-type ATP synthase assembly protein I
MASQRTSNLVKEASGWAIASNFAFGVAGMCVIGWILQTYIWPNAAPWLLVGFAVAGVIGGGYRFMKDAMDANRSMTKASKDHQPPSSKP